MYDAPNAVEELKYPRKYSSKEKVEAIKDALKQFEDNLIPQELTPAQIAYTYVNEVDMLNVVLFGKTARQWKDENLTEKGNMRDVVTLNQLLVLANLESYNAVLINQGKKEQNYLTVGSAAIADVGGAKFE